MKIEVEERPKKKGKPIVQAIIGPSMDLYEIWHDVRARKSKTRYYVNHVEIPRQVYLDAFTTADKDRWEPDEDDLSGAGSMQPAVVS